MSQVDPRFLQARKQASLRQKRKKTGMRWPLLVVGGLVMLMGLAGSGWMVWQAGLIPIAARDPGVMPVKEPVAGNGGADAGLATTPLRDAAEAPLSAPAPEEDDGRQAFRGSIDLPGDPLLLNLGQAGGGAAPTRLPRPDSLPAPRGAGDVLLVQAPLLEPGERLSVSLPTSPEDFAIFQAQRQRMIQASQRGVEAPIAPADGRIPRPQSVAEARALVAHASGSAGRLGADAHALIPTYARQRPISDSFLKISRGADLAGLLELEGLSAPQAEQVARVASQALGLDQLQAGQILALRQLRRPDGSVQFAQLAIYDGDRYLGALGRGEALDSVLRAPISDESDQGINQAEPLHFDIGIAADPWLRQDLPALLEGTARSGGQSTSTPRVMDALYASALRHGLSPGQVGQIIMLLAQTHKLDEDAMPDDRMTLMFSATLGAAQDAASASDLDQILYIALESGAETRLRCYVHRPGPERAPACYGPTRGSGPAATTTAGVQVRASAGTQSLTGGDAVEHLVNRIIQIESAGRADARNPLSTATGLGQFIESTWLRMMRTYRPDLSATLSRAELLALRTDPDVSREMVLNLAREGESYLRARGHEITAGRLYLAHFLGMEGAHAALSAAPETDLMTLFGAGVINANPFLRGRDAGYVVSWAESRMRGASGRIAVIREPDGLVEFRQTIDALLSTL